MLYKIIKYQDDQGITCVLCNLLNRFKKNNKFQRTTHVILKSPTSKQKGKSTLLSFARVCHNIVKNQ